MIRFAQTVIDRLKECRDASAVGDWTVAAADCLSKAKVSGFYSGFCPEIDAEGVTDAEALAIEHELLELYGRNPRAEGISSVVWALSKARNPLLRSLFIEHARDAMQRLATAYSELSQCVIGLEDISDPPAVQAGRSEIMKDALDVADAYLREAGYVIPI